MRKVRQSHTVDFCDFPEVFGHLTFITSDSVCIRQFVANVSLVNSVFKMVGVTKLIVTRHKF